MLRTALGTTLIAFAACAAFAQAPGGPTFDVASVKPAPPPTGKGFMVMMNGGPGSKDPGRVNYSNVSLKDMIRMAYELKDYQVTGPDWMASARFDVVATLPPTTPKDEYLKMWQNLLADRFKITLHREKKDFPIYALVVAKGGSKLKESVEDSSSTTATAPPPVSFGGPSGAGTPAGGATNTFTFQRSAGGGGVPAGKGSMMQMGRGHLSAKKTTVTSLADMLSRQLDRPVLDLTELTGSYDFVLDWAPDDTQRSMMPAGLPGSEGRPADAAAESTGASIFTAVQAQLGLKLEARKSPLDSLVIDHAEKVPTEN